jgi:hypothetical protein
MSSQEPVARPYSEPLESSQQIHILFLYNPFYNRVYPLTYAYLFQVISSGTSTKILHAFLISVVSDCSKVTKIPKRVFYYSHFSWDVKLI